MLDELIIPKNYRQILGLRQTAIGIKAIKDFFERDLAKKLNLTRVSAPLFVKAESGLNDTLNGVERPVSFDLKKKYNIRAEIVHSLAKWKRMALSRYGFEVGEGIYTDMDAIRRDEELDNTHSIYVDQWDWEKVIKKEDRTLDTLKLCVKKIYSVCQETENYLFEVYPQIEKILPEKIFFITSQELEERYPKLNANEREYAISKEKGAVFIMQIGHILNSGVKHDGRAPDYDDWRLNGDIIFYYPVLDIALEMSSMGIRVDKKSLEEQLILSDCEERKQLEFHKLLLEGKLPLTIGGGIGQSRLCMFFLKKAHIGEVQASIWPKKMRKQCEEFNINLL